MHSILTTTAAALALAGALTAAPADDAKAIVAALDTQYQAAVKANDAAAMDRTLGQASIAPVAQGSAERT
jgi:hypothetical protein